MHTIEHTIETPASPDAAYAALTTPAGLKAWWSKDCDVGPAEVGGAHALRFVKGERTVTMEFEVNALEPGERVEWRCTANGNPVWVGTTLRWSIEASGDGATVRFAHEGFAEGGSPPYVMTVDGWKHFNASLEAHLRGEPGQPW